jgi:probable HAF family extracellular repeat protein
MRKAFWGAFALIAAFVGSGAELYSAIQYGGGRVWNATDINDHDEVVGGFDGAYYGNGPGLVEAIPALEGPTGLMYSKLYGINNRGVMVGVSTTGTNNTGPRRAFLFDRAVGMARDLGSLGGPRGESTAWAINENDVVVGDSQTTNGTHAVRFELNGTITDLRTLGGDWSIAQDINDVGEIVGQSKNADGDWRAFVIHGRNSMVDIGTLGGKEARGHRINNKGQIVGAAQTANGEWHAFLWSQGTMNDLGTLEGGAYSEAWGINDDGVVVGAFQDKFSYSKAFVRYADGQMRDLETVVELPLPDDKPTMALDINNNGSIVVAIFHPSYRTGVEYPEVLRPGKVKTTVAGTQWEVRIGAPPGYGVQLDATQDFKSWTAGLTTSAQGEEFVRNEPLGEGARFFRVSIKPVATP